MHCSYPKRSCSMEVNKEELLIHILQGTNNTYGMYPMRQTALQVYVILMWHVGMFVGIARLVETGNDGCFHAVHRMRLFTTLRCKN